MLQKPKDIAEMIMMDLAHHCAEDPETGAYLVRSDGCIRVEIIAAQPRVQPTSGGRGKNKGQVVTATRG